jgi:hypothetical protein
MQKKDHKRSNQALRIYIPHNNHKPLRQVYISYIWTKIIYLTNHKSADSRRKPDLTAQVTAKRAQATASDCTCEQLLHETANRAQVTQLLQATANRAQANSAITCMTT